jgi:hypothetical protein
MLARPRRASIKVRPAALDRRSAESNWIERAYVFTRCRRDPLTKEGSIGALAPHGPQSLCSGLVGSAAPGTQGMAFRYS